MQVRKALQPLIYVALCAAASSGAAAQVLSGMPNDGYHDRNDSSSVLENAMLAFCPQVLINPEKTGYFSGLEEEWDTEDGGRAFFRDFIAEDILVLAYPEEQTCTVLLDESITDVTLSRRIIEGKLRLDGFVLQNTDEPNRLFTKDGSEWRYVITQEEDKVFFQVLR